ncbi:MAG: hypothetical protein KC800_00765 [Candidatus Eremiobacteraeota bacterium]|nr:hypothetical protein [Candidatus Eremiobacteraeota bacterium]
MNRAGLSMVFARAPWGEIQLETDGGLKGFSHRDKLFKIHFSRQKKSIGTSRDRRSEATNGWANYLDIGINREQLPYALGHDGICSFTHLHESAHGSVEYKVRLQFFPPKKRLFWWSLRVNCEMSVIVDISR